MLGNKRNKHCLACRGTGVVSYSSEYSNLKDRRLCSNCEQGRVLGERIGRIVEQMTVDQQPKGIKGYSLFAIP